MNIKVTSLIILTAALTACSQQNTQQMTAPMVVDRSSDIVMTPVKETTPPVINVHRHLGPQLQPDTAKLYGRQPNGEVIQRDQYTPMPAGNYSALENCPSEYKLSPLVLPKPAGVKYLGCNTGIAVYP